MTQAENNKAAMDKIFALEDSKELFEAVGNLNDDQSMMGNTPDNTEYGVDDMLTVVPGSTDPFAGQSITTQQEPSEEEKRFVIDEFAAQMAKAHKTIVDKEAIDTFSPIIQDKVSMNVNQFLTDVQNAATQRLSAQNVSDAQPTGATPEENLALADQQQQGGMDAGMDPNAAMGTPAMEPAPGGIAPEPSLDANVGDPMGGDAGAVPGDDLGLGNIDNDMVGDMGDLGTDAGAGDDLGLGGITDDAGDLGGEGDAGADLGGDAGGEGGDDLGLGAISDDTGADAGESEGAAGEGVAEGGDTAGDTAGDEGGADDDVLGGKNNLDSLDDSQFGDTDDDKTKFDDDDDSDAAFEAEMESSRAILESLHAKYVEDKAREDVRVLVESFQRAKNAKKAQLEAEQAGAATEEKPAGETDDKPAVTEAGDEAAKPADAVVANEKPAETEYDQKLQESAEETMRNELGEKVAAMLESESRRRAEAILENAAKAFAGAEKRKVQAEERAHLKATLESISANYHASVARENAAKVEKQRALHEAAMQSKQAPKQTTLAQKLNKIVASVK